MYQHYILCYNAILCIPLIKDNHIEKVPFSALTLLVRQKEGYPVCEKVGVGLLTLMMWMELTCLFIAPVPTTTYVALSSNKIRMETFWYHITSNPGPPGKMGVKIERETETDRLWQPWTHWWKTATGLLILLLLPPPPLLCLVFIIVQLCIMH